MSAQDNIRIVREFFDAFNNGDQDRAVTFFDANAESIDVATGVRLHGLQEMRQNFESLRQAFPDLKTQITNIFADEDSVCVEYGLGGTFKGPLDLPGGRIQPTGRQANLSQCDVYHISNGKIVMVRTYSDSATMMNQLGVPFGFQKAA